MLETLFLVFLFVFLLVKYVMERNGRGDESSSLSLPPGTMGWPMIGETFKLAVQKVEFFRQKRKLYGKIFKTHLFGSPVIRVTGHSNVREILRGENKYVQSSYPKSTRTLLGPNALSMSKGVLHKSRKVQLMQYLSPEFLRKHHASFNSLIDNHMKRWSSEPSVDIYLEIRSLFTEMAAKFLIDMDIPLDTTRHIKELYEQFTDGIFSTPINLPGFSLHKGLQAKNELKRIFTAIIKGKGQSITEFPSVLQAYGAELNEHVQYDDDRLLDAIIELMWNASETVSSAAFGIVYHLTRNPLILQKVREELEFDDSKNTTGPCYIDCVVKEALRVMPPVGGAYRKLTKPITMEGFTLPKDWTVVCGFRDTHENDDTIADPTKFDPDRWLQDPNSSDRASFLSFGGGLRICPGKNYALVVLKLFTKRLCDRLVWKFLTKDPELDIFPSPKPKHALYTCFFDKLGQCS